MDNLVNKPFILKLNKNWVPVGIDSVRDGFKNLAKGTHKALHITYPYDEEGNEIYDPTRCNIDVVTFDEWIKLKGRQCDRWVNTGRQISGEGSRVRIPTILLALNCYKNLIVDIPFTLENIRIRDENICQYSGAKISREQGNIEHICPVSKGGETSWENCVWVDKKINSLKGDMSLKEFSKKYGYKLIRAPKKPRPRAMIDLIRNVYNIPDWDLFLKKEQTSADSHKPRLR